MITSCDVRGQWDATLYKQLLGAANEFKEGDAIIGVAAIDDAVRRQARELLSFTILHIIAERPGSGHHTLSVYMTRADGQTWGIADKVDHNITKVVSGIANTALAPETGAIEAVRILRQTDTHAP